MNSNIDTVTSIYRAFGQGDVASILDRLAPQLEWDRWDGNAAQDAGHPLLVERTDPQGAGAFFRAVGEHLAIHEFKVVDVFGSGRQVAVEVLIDCTYRATGTRVRDEEMHLWTFDGDGRVDRFRHYIDTAKHLRGAGLLQA